VLPTEKVRSRSYCTLLQFEQFHHEVHTTMHNLRTASIQALLTFRSLHY